MHLKSIELQTFRNFSAAHFEFCSGLNIFFGPNACGKTNLLEAIHVLSNLRSFRTHVLRELIQWDTTQAYVRGQLQNVHSEQDTVSTKTLAVEIRSGARISLINSKQCTSSREYLRIFPAAAFIPDDLDLIKGAPASRRYFLDKGTFHFYPPYWSLLTDYNKLLRQKNALLRNSYQGTPPRGKNVQDGRRLQKDAPLDIWNIQLQSIGSQIILRRLQFVQHIQRFVNEVYRKWLGTTETVELVYKSNIGLKEKVNKSMFDSNEEAEKQQKLNELVELYAHALQHNQERETRLGTAIIGPHRDDLHVKLSGRLLRSYGSQGQQRTAVLALKLAEANLAFERYGEYPVLLLDDVSSELDGYRNKGLFECLQQGMQVFMSSTEKPDVVSSCALPVQYFDLSEYGG